MQLQEQLCHCRRMLHYKQGLLRGIPSKNLEDTILYKANKAQVETGSLTINHIQPSAWWASVLWFRFITDSDLTRVTWVNYTNIKILTLAL